MASRIGSLKGKTPASPRGGKFRNAVVVLPNNTSFDIRIQPSLLGLELFRLAASRLRLHESEHFGLKWFSSQM